jgi:hypothetical protein
MKPSKRMTEPTARRPAVRAVDGLDLDRRALDLGGLHLAGDGALPDQIIETGLVGIEIRFTSRACDRRNPSGGSPRALPARSSPWPE